MSILGSTGISSTGGWFHFVKVYTFLKRDAGPGPQRAFESFSGGEKAPASQYLLKQGETAVFSQISQVGLRSFQKFSFY